MDSVSGDGQEQTAAGARARGARAAGLPLPPGNRCFPIIGETLSFIDDPWEWTQRRSRQFGPVFSTHLMGRRTVVFVGREPVHFLLSNENRLFAAGDPAVRLPKVYGGSAQTTRALLGRRSLIGVQGAPHLHRRVVLRAVLDGAALRRYAPTVESIADKHVSRWATAGELTWRGALSTFTFEVAARLFLGLDEAEAVVMKPSFEAVSMALFDWPIPTSWTRFGRAMHARAEVVSRFDALIARRRASGDLGSDALGELLRAVDEEGRPLDLEEICDHLVLLLFAGHETVTSALVSFFMLVGQDDDVRTRLAEEAAHYGDDLTPESLGERRYLKQVVKEVLRMYPPVGGGYRNVLEDCEYEGYRIPKGWMAMFQVGQVHMDASVYPSPERFDPERFNDVREEDKAARGAYIPFGVGSRACLGMAFAPFAIGLLASMVLRRYDWKLTPDQDLTLVRFPVPAPRSGLRVRLSPRAST